LVLLFLSYETPPTVFSSDRSFERTKKAKIGGRVGVLKQKENTSHTKVTFELFLSPSTKTKPLPTETTAKPLASNAGPMLKPGDIILFKVTKNFPKPAQEPNMFSP